MAINLNGAVVCVTGGARGIGKETARHLSEKGAEVWIGDIDIDAAKQTALELGPRGHAHRLDVTDPESFKTFIAASGKPITMLVNNAGVMHVGAFHDIPLDTHIREIAINLTGVMTGMHLVLPGMLERNEGHIVNVASMAGKFTLPGVANYNASKFGVVALSRAVRNEIAHTRVTISTVMPSAVRTELTSGISTWGVPTIDPADVAAVIVDSAHRCQNEIAIPRWADSLGVAEQLLPEMLFDGFKRLFGGKRLLDQVDAEKRKAYASRT